MNIPKLTRLMLITIFVFCMGATNLLAGDSLSRKGEVIKITGASGIVEIGNLNNTIVKIGSNQYLYVKDSSGKEIKIFLNGETKYSGIKKGESVKANDIVVVTYKNLGKPHMTDKGFGIIRLNVASLVKVISNAKKGGK